MEQIHDTDIVAKNLKLYRSWVYGKTYHFCYRNSKKKKMTSNVAIPVDQCLDQHASEKLLAIDGN